MRGAPLLQGTVADGFEPVADAFAACFAEHGELGAAFSAVHDGCVVVDLWGGLADEASGAPWRRDTLVPIFSGTKGLVAVCLLLLIERGQLELDRPVAAYWPEFAAAGKERVRVREVVSHTCRLPAIEAPLEPSDLFDPAARAAQLAAQPPASDPRAGFVYHPLTYGWLCGELVRRADGRTLGAFFADEVAAPLGLDAWIGLPAAEEDRVASLRYDRDWAAGEAALEAAVARDALARAVWSNPSLFPAGEIYWNARAFHAAEIPGVNAIATARGMARLYGCLARGGELDGVRVLGPDAVTLGATAIARGVDPLTDRACAFGVGFQLQTEEGRYGPPADAFGHDGAGGSVHGAWPRERVGFSYAMNAMRWIPAGEGDLRVDRLLAALHACVTEKS